jgi:hypothetical protein
MTLSRMARITAASSPTRIKLTSMRTARVMSVTPTSTATA